MIQYRHEARNDIPQSTRNEQNYSDNTMKNPLKKIPARFHSKLILSLDALKKSEWYRQVTDPQKIGALLEHAEKWLKTHQGNKPICSQLLKVVTTLQRMHRNNQLFTRKNALVLAAIVLYTVSPADTVPDVLPAIGLLDDLLLILLGLSYMQGEQSAAPAADPETSRKA